MPALYERFSQGLPAQQLHLQLHEERVDVERSGFTLQKLVLQFRYLHELVDCLRVEQEFVQELPVWQMLLQHLKFFNNVHLKGVGARGLNSFAQCYNSSNFFERSMTRLLTLLGAWSFSMNSRTCSRF